MRMEESYTSYASCPCGKGKIFQKHYEGVDWYSEEDGPVTIDCRDCNSKFVIEEESRSGPLLSDHRRNAYYLTPIGYPRYEGPEVIKAFPKITYTNENFVGWLIENYTEESLNNALNQINNASSSKMLKGIAAQISNIHKKACHSVRLNKIKEAIELSILQYNSYNNGNYLQRQQVLLKEEIARSTYKEEKRKHQILIEFDR
ncbi:MAG: hypothetical protein IKW81_14150 [Pseudobutyrivibrio sp.]|nr:hypothetical protein [Pseudobutyrivibrio sp.]